MKTDVQVENVKEYEFDIHDDIIQPEYRFCTSISTWLHDNLESLTDDAGKEVFSKVSYGYDEQKLKGFGKKPTADIHIDNIEYTEDIGNKYPEKVNTIIIFYTKGTNDHSYLTTGKIHDILIQSLLTKDEWRELQGLVRDTTITNSQITNNPSGKWGCIGAVQLTHHLYEM